MNYFILNLLEIQQFNSNKFYYSTITFKELNETSRLTSRADSPTDGYQREFNLLRLKKISNYIEKSMFDEDMDIPIFPTPLVLSVESSLEINDKLNQVSNKEEEYEKLILDYFNIIKEKKLTSNETEILNIIHRIENEIEKVKETEKVEELIKNRELKNLTDSDIDILNNPPLSSLVNDKLFVPKVKDSLFIVDGQHRFKGMQKLYYELLKKKFESENTLLNDDEYEQVLYKIRKLENFKFVVSILLDFDLYQQSRIFANINFNQKSVNRSLYYDIFGSIYREKDEVTFIHYLVKSLNETNEFENIIKMLGSGSGTVSLAFMVQTINEYLINNSLRKYVKEYLEDSGHLYLNLPDFFYNYFLFIKDNFNDYFPICVYENIEKNGKTINVKKFKSSQYKSFLFKTTGIFGLLNLINDLAKLESTIFIMDKTKLDEFLEKKLDITKIKSILDNPKYLNTAGKGLQKDFYYELKKCINV
jgi:DGQHR domain-containing protein